MRQLLAICSAVGLLCGVLGCHSCCSGVGGCGGGCRGGCGVGGGHVSGRCDCDEGPEYGCHYDMYAGGHGGAVAGHATAAAMPQAEPLKALPKDVAPKEE